MDAWDGCKKLVFDRKNAARNESIANMYGSELAGDFGKIFCGKPIVYNERCSEHLVDRRIGPQNRRRS